MPSDSKKKAALAKKAANKKPSKKVLGTNEQEENGGNESDSQHNSGDEQNGGSGGDDSFVKVNGTSSAASSPAAAAPAAKTSPKTNGKSAVDKLTEKMDSWSLLEKQNAENRACTGVLASHPHGRDTHISQLSITFYGHELLVDADLELNGGRRYGLIGPNGSGKSTLLSAIAHRDVPIPKHVDIFHLTREIAATDKTAVEAVLDCDEELKRLEEEAEELALCDDVESHDRLTEIYERLDELSSDLAETKVAKILHGLGFTPEMQKKKCRDFSGGWRMRVALARAIYLSPSLLLLDEPTNHLDLDACVWLEEELKKYKRTLVIISHSQDFMNGVCTNIINLHKKKLTVYGGNYDTYISTRAELETNQSKKYQQEQDQIAHMKDYIARFGHGSAKLARQAQSKEKVLKKMVDGGLTERVESDRCLSFAFPDCGKIPPPVIMVQNVSFKYKDDTQPIYKCLDFGIDLDSRIALVGPNGAGKSTLLKLISGHLLPTDGQVRRNAHLKIGRYHQHLAEELDLNMTALDYMMQQFPDIKEKEEMRKIIGRYGLSGRQQICPLKNLSDGQRCRVIFAWLACQVPHLLLLDEPTNHLDIETIDALAEALNAFEGGLILVSHDFRLINQVAQEIWVCEKQKITKWTGDILSYKSHLKKKIKF